MKGYDVFGDAYAESALKLFEVYIATGTLTPIVIHKSASTHPYELLIVLSDLYGSEVLQNLAMDQVIIWHALLKLDKVIGQRSIYKLCELTTRQTRRVMQEMYFNYFLGHTKQMQQALSTKQGWEYLPAGWQQELVQLFLKKENRQWTRVLPSKNNLCTFHVHTHTAICRK